MNFPQRARAIRTLLFSLFAVAVASCGGGGSGTPAPSPPPPGDASEWLLDTNFIFDGGPGRDGIPALTDPNFESAATIRTVGLNDLAVAVKHGGTVKIYPQDILDWHEVVNDGPEDDPMTLSYCPLTGSAVAWKGTVVHADPSFGVSGLLFNSNLLLYDRETASLWSQMYETAIFGSRIREGADRIQVIEAKFSTLRDMFPDSMTMTRVTGFVRDYPDYPYGDYREISGLLFPVTNVDNRMHPKTRVIGVRDGDGVDDSVTTKVYQLSGFGASTLAINDQVGSLSVVVIGNTELDFAVIYDRELEDGTILTFSPIEGDGANIMRDDEGNVWDAFGVAVSGPRTGTQLKSTNSYTAFWFAWVAHFPNSDFHFPVFGP